jgi:hypothetical protein
MFGDVIAVEPRGVVGLDDTQTVCVLRFERRRTPIDVIEDGKFGDRRYFTITGSVPLTTGAVVYASFAPVVAKQM